MMHELEPRLARQACPFCGQEQEIIVNGHTPSGNPDNRHEVRMDLDRGYSFCNCRNIFYTNWANMRQTVYSAEYTDKYEMPGAKETYEQYARAYFHKLLKLTSGRRFLEIGCVTSHLLDAAKEYGFQTSGVDMIPHQFEQHETIIANFEELQTDQKYDVIWASHIFEHFQDPLKAISKCHDLLNPNGLLFVAMPDPFTIDYAAAHLWGHWHLDEHHIMWDMDSFCTAAEERGFRTEMKLRNFGTNFICIGDYHLLFQKVS